ncbi:hypothetical protein T492DRAFT_1007115 [Pavlovales sp. CCMP2436]|nr:hypothetical protein T492DRAFT_1007115 [Pavlovales sp. CCMP2436]
MPSGKWATLQDLIDNPYSVERVGKDSYVRDQVAKDMYELNLRELTRMLNGQRGMWMLRLNTVGAIEESWRCRASEKVKQGCFTIFIPAPGEQPRFGHTNCLSDQQRFMYPIMQKDATTIALAQERAHTAKKEGLLSAEDAEDTLTDLRRRFFKLPPSTSAREEVRAAELEAVARAARERESIEAAAAEAEMPSFEGLMATFAAEDERRAGSGGGGGDGAGVGAGALAAEGGASDGKSRRRRKTKKGAEAGAQLATPRTRM